MRDAIQFAAIVFGVIGFFMSALMLVFLAGPHVVNFIVDLIATMGAVQFAFMFLALSIASLTVAAKMQRQD